MRDSVAFYRSFAEAIKTLPEEEQLKALWAIIDYGLDEITPEEYGIHTAIFLMAKPQIDANNKRYQNGTKGGRPITEQKPNQNQTETKAEPNHNQTITKPKPNNNQTETKPKPNHNQTITKAEPNLNNNLNDNLNDNLNVKVKDKESVCTRFVPPTHQDVSDYCQEKGYTNVDIERFIDFYESKGWMVGKNKMKDWKAAVRNWNRSQRQELTTKGNKFNNFNQRQYDYDALEQQLLGGGAAHGK